jgi:hypothetical protein
MRSRSFVTVAEEKNLINGGNDTASAPDHQEHFLHLVGVVYVYYSCLDRESNPRPLAYGNTASIEGTTMLTTKPNPLLQNIRFNDQGRT